MTPIRPDFASNQRIIYRDNDEDRKSENQNSYCSEKVKETIRSQPIRQNVTSRYSRYNAQTIDTRDLEQERLTQHINHTDHPTGTKRKREDEEYFPRESKVQRTNGRDHVTGFRESIKDLRNDRLNSPPRKFTSMPRVRSASASKIHSLPMMGEIYLRSIESGIKKFEGRINGPAVEKMNVGDELKLFDRKAGWGILCKIVSKDVYHSFESMLQAKGILSLLPQLTEESTRVSPAKLLEIGAAIYRKFPGSHRVSQCGIAAIGVTFIEKIYHNR